MKTFYTASATATSGREGRVVGEEPKLDLRLSVPKAFGGPGGEGTNPEQLFAGGYAACFSSALAHVARSKTIDLGEYTMTGRVSIGKLDASAYGLAVELVGAFPSLAKEQAESLIEETSADELLLVSDVYDRKARLRSFERVASAMPISALAIPG